MGKIFELVECELDCGAGCRPWSGSLLLHGWSSRTRQWCRDSKLNSVCSAIVSVPVRITVESDILTLREFSPARLRARKKHGILKSDRTVLTVCAESYCERFYCRVGNTNTTGIFPFRSKFFQVPSQTPGTEKLTRITVPCR